MRERARLDGLLDSTNSMGGDARELESSGAAWRGPLEASAVEQVDERRGDVYYFPFHGPFSPFMQHQ
jgi:hypothetical protein